MCTCLKIKAKDNSTVVGRTMEFGLDPGSKITVFPRGIKYKGRRHDDKPSFSWESQYGFVGMNLLDKTMTDDGINEKGLYVGLLYLPNFAQYQEIGESDLHRAISQLDVPAYLLSMCSTVDEAKKALSDIFVYGVYEDLVFHFKQIC